MRLCQDGLIELRFAKVSASVHLQETNFSASVEIPTLKCGMEKTEKQETVGGADVPVEELYELSVKCMDERRCVNGNWYFIFGSATLTNRTPGSLNPSYSNTNTACKGVFT